MEPIAQARRADFETMEEATRDDWLLIASEQKPFMAALPDRVLAHLQLLSGDFGGFPIDRLQHCLQCASLAADAGEDEEYVVCALLHDIGDTLGSYNHSDIAAAILKPFVSEENHWMVQQHGVFQGHYFFHYLGLDRNLRDQYRGHPAFERTTRFCDLFDQPAFSRRYSARPLTAFAPMVHRVLSTPKSSLYQAAL